MSNASTSPDDRAGKIPDREGVDASLTGEPDRTASAGLSSAPPEPDLSGTDPHPAAPEDEIRKNGEKTDASPDQPCSGESSAEMPNDPDPAAGKQSYRAGSDGPGPRNPPVVPPAGLPPEMAADIPSRYAEARSRSGSPHGEAPRDDSTPRPTGSSAAGSTASVEPGPASRLFGILAWAGLPVLLILTALMTASELLTIRSLWFSDEVRHADVYMRLLEGNWLALNLNGVPYPDKPPLYFWFLRLLDSVPGVDAPLLFFAGTALSSLLFIGSTWLLARATGHDRRVAFASGLLCLGCLFFAGLTHYPRMDLAFASVITLSLLCLYRGWIKTSAPLWLTFGFVLAGIAALIKGPLALAFPLLASILFLIWRGTPGRLNGRDGLVGFALMLLMLLGWAAALYFRGEVDYLGEIFGPQIAGRMVDAWHHAAPWWYYLAALPLVCLPWTFLILFVNWWAALKDLPGAWKRRREDGGRGWLWCTLLGGLVLLSAVSGKIAIYLLPLMPALAVIGARALLRLPPRRSRWYFFCTGLLLGLTGLALVLAQASPWLLPLLPDAWTTLLPPIARAYLDNTSGLALMGVVLLALAVVLLFLTRRALPDGSLLVSSLGIVILMQPYALTVAPSLETMLSPRAQAEAMADYVRQGHVPASYRVYPGIYSYYLNEALSSPGDPRPSVTVTDVDDRAALEALMAEHPRMIVAMREKDWIRWEDKPLDFQEVQRQWLVDQPYILAVWDHADNGQSCETQEAPVPDGTEDDGEDPVTPSGPDAMPPLPDDAPATNDGLGATLIHGSGSESGFRPFVRPPAEMSPGPDAAPAVVMPGGRAIIL